MQMEVNKGPEKHSTTKVDAGYRIALYPHVD